ncbi:MAG: radical SAM protein [Proteobacteria bacterium]|nr:radical SAM protein [Pseudomonadota bacterium]
MTAGKKTACGAKPVHGSREWAVAEINCCHGCPHGCRYCYARYDMVERRRILSPEEWQQCRTVEEDVARLHPLYPGQVMFPTAHDIIPDNLDVCMATIDNLLAAGNKVLVVSKPHLECIRALCARFGVARDRLLFRFTITARDQGLLGIWEPRAPGYEERKSCLRYAFRQSFATSVSVEPMLDTQDVVAMVHELLPFISHSIWLGKMNKIDQRVVVDSAAMRVAVEMLKKGQEDTHILRIYKELASVPLVRWKDSVKQVVGLMPAEQPGLDI